MAEDKEALDSISGEIMPGGLSRRSVVGLVPTPGCPSFILLILLYSVSDVYLVSNANLA